MKRRILIALFALIFVLGIFGVLNRTPKVEIGEVWLSCGGKETAVEGEEVSSLRNGKLEQSAKSFDIAKLADTLPAFEQTVAKNEGTHSVTRSTNMAVSFNGRLAGDVIYTVYDLNGNVLSDNETTLNLPTKDTEGCVVRIDVKWGREKNYKQYYYFFRVDFVKE